MDMSQIVAAKVQASILNADGTAKEINKAVAQDFTAEAKGKLLDNEERKLRMVKELFEDLAKATNEDVIKHINADIARIQGL